MDYEKDVVCTIEKDYNGYPLWVSGTGHGVYHGKRQLTREECYTVVTYISHKCRFCAAKTSCQARYTT